MAIGMDSLHFLFFFCCSLLLIAGASAEGAPSTLLMVNIVYRHGDRSPVRTFPTNPLPESAWPQGFGQLTQRGMMQHFELGKYLRSRYIDGSPYQLVNASYNRLEVRVRSTDYDRTLMSAYSNLAGLYPPSGAQVWNKAIPWQPIPVHTVPQMEDYLLNEDVPCRKYDEYYEAALNGEDIRKEEEENKGFYELLENVTGIKNLNITDAWEAFDPVYCARQHGMLEPEWVNTTWKGRTIYEKLEAINSLQFDVQFNRPGENRFRGGPLLGEMVRNMKQRINGSEVERVHIYSSHDSTMSAIMGALKVFNSVAPPYASSAFVELHGGGGGADDAGHVIRIFYRNDSSREPYQLQVPGCALDCPFEDFLRITKENIPGDWYSECKGTMLPRTDGLILLATGIILMTVVIVTILIVAIVRSQRQRRGYVAYDGLAQKEDGTF